jgi:hypothetical protein
MARERPPVARDGSRATARCTQGCCGAAHAQCMPGGQSQPACGTRAGVPNLKSRASVIGSARAWCAWRAGSPPRRIRSICGVVAHLQSPLADDDLEDKFINEQYKNWKVRRARLSFRLLLALSPNCATLTPCVLATLPCVLCR